jgi:hypothetical protein
MKTSPKSRRIPGDTYDSIRAKAKLGWSASQILRGVEEEGRSASLPVIREIRDESRKPDGPWHVNLGEAFALEVLMAIVERSREPDGGARQATLTRSEVSQIVAIRGAAPDVPAAAVYWLAQDYLDRAEGADADDLNLTLAFARAGAEGDQIFAHVATHFAHWRDRPLVALCSSEAIMHRYEAEIRGLTGLGVAGVWRDEQAWKNGESAYVKFRVAKKEVSN